MHSHLDTSSKHCSEAQHRTDSSLYMSRLKVRREEGRGEAKRGKTQRKAWPDQHVVCAMTA